MCLNQSPTKPINWFLVGLLEQDVMEIESESSIWAKSELKYQSVFPSHRDRDRGPRGIPATTALKYKLPDWLTVACQGAMTSWGYQRRES